MFCGHIMQLVYNQQLARKSHERQVFFPLQWNVREKLSLKWDWSEIKCSVFIYMLNQRAATWPVARLPVTNDSIT